MNFAAILAGGVGTRMGNLDKPKQYLHIQDKPIIVYTVEKFLYLQEFERVIVLCPQEWVQPTKDILKQHLGDNEKLVVIAGGKVRNDTIMNAVAYIEEHYDKADEAVLVTHDSVRPFVTYRIIQDNLKALETYNACDTVIPATDTIVVSNNGEIVDEIPDRKTMYQGQTPQSFKIGTLKDLYETLHAEERDILTDAAKICILRGEKVALVDGETFNIKITYPTDLRLASALLGVED